MISELEALAVLDGVRKSRGKLGYEETRAASILASLFCGRLVRYDSLLDAIDSLRNKGFLKGSQENLRLSTEGKALLQSIGERRIGKTRLYSLTKQSEPLASAHSASEYVHEFGPRVTDIANSQKHKLTEPPGDVVLCAMLVQVIIPGDLHVSFFPLPEPLRQDGASLWRAISSTRARLSAEVNVPVHVSMDHGRLVVIAPQEYQTTELDNHMLVCDETRKAGANERSSYSAMVAEDVMADRLAQDGYAAVGNLRRVFVRGYKRGAHGGTSGVPAVRLVYQKLDSEYLLIWVEEFTKPWTTALDLIAGAATENEILLRLEGRSLRVLPYESWAHLVNVIPDVNLHQAIVPNSSANYLDYWSDIGFELEEEIQPLLVMRTKTGQYNYPAEMVLTHDKGSDIMTGHEPSPLSPSKRCLGLRKVANVVFQESTVRWKRSELRLVATLPSMQDLPELQRPRAFFINPPILRFANGVFATDPLDVFTIGPEAGRKRIAVRSVFYPSDSDPESCVKALEVLCQHYSRRGFGEARIDPALQKIGYLTNADSTEIGSLIRKTSKHMSTESIGVAILKEDGDKYHAFKRYFPEYSQCPLQAVQLSTIPEIIAGRKDVLDQLALNLYLKRLDQREAAWTLASPAGGSQMTAFIAMAFSRSLDPRRAGKGVAVLHDSMGRGLRWDLLMTPGERTITQAWFEVVIDQILPLLEEEPIERMVMYRKGRLDPVEVNAINQALEKKMKHTRKIEFISVLDEHRRFFVRHDGTLQNPPPGTTIVWSDEEALLSESGFAERGIWKGTVVPVSLKRVIGFSTIEQIAAEYHDQTHLSWSAPYTTWKHPLVMKIADRLAEAAREGIPSNAIRYIPL